MPLFSYGIKSNELLDLDEKDGMECERILMGMEIEKLKND